MFEPLPPARYREAPATLRAAARLLNEANGIDPVFMRDAFSTRWRVNLQMAEHPALEVESTPSGFEVGLLALVNAMFGNTNYRLGVEARQDESISRFSILENVNGG